MSWNFILFSRILIGKQLTLFLDDLEVQKCAHAQSKSSSICIFKTTKNSHSIFIEMKTSLLHEIPFYFILYSENQCISKLDKIGI